MAPLADDKLATENATVTENGPADSTHQLFERFLAVRGFTNRLCETLTPEDCCLQSMPAASPVRWHLAHTSWFFETFVLKQDPLYQVFDRQYEVLFNSYYNAVGEQFPRADRGLLSRPSLSEVFAYRAHVEQQVKDCFASGRIAAASETCAVVELGIQHEQQHQELILTDVKNLFSRNPLLPTFRPGDRTSAVAADSPPAWLELEGGMYAIGHAGRGFAYDNEGPSHQVYLPPFAMGRRLVTSGDYLEFMQDGGYTRPELWLSLGWDQVKESHWRHPLYWFQQDKTWYEFTLAGPRLLDLEAPVCHISYFEAEAFARWSGARLPTEAEWEVTAEQAGSDGNFSNTRFEEDLSIHPDSRFVNAHPLAQMFGDVWEWTASPYTSYPGYRPANGALGEYNGKFMCNQYVLRGGSVATPSSHIRPTYRNFFPPEARWQFSGMRLAQSV